MGMKKVKIPATEKVDRSLTKSEELLASIGKPVYCDICHKQVVMGHNWLMTPEKEAVCPSCQPSVVNAGSLLVTI
jgi:hypothetical protein